MKKKKDADNAAIVGVNNVGEADTKLEDERNYFANDNVDFKEKSNYEGRNKGEGEGYGEIGPEGPAEPVRRECENKKVAK